MPQFSLIALTPPGLSDPSIAIAAARAGALGLLDLEFATDGRAARAAIARLAHYARQSCGIKLDSRAHEFMAHVITDLPEPIEVVILTAGAPDCLPQQVQALRQQGRTVLLEITSLEQALLGEQLAVDGLIAKGHEAGGWVGQETAFILLQQVVTRQSLPVWVQGGIGLHTAAGCYTAGAAGAVLDAQLVLTVESPLTETVKGTIARMDGGETLCLGDELGQLCRVYARRRLAPVEELRQVAQALMDDPRPQAQVLAAWHRAVGHRVGWRTPEQDLWLLGQDVAFAAPLARRFRTVGGVLQGIRQAVDEQVRAVRVLRPLDEGAPLARSHRTRYPIVQGPMARISDTPAFAAHVAEGGGLPFLALSLLRSAEVEVLLRETEQRLGEASWGVGVLGFAPAEILREQWAAIRAHRPPFALVAGGRPDQARALEKEGIQTYLHVPSPELLRMFLRDGGRRFVFEGREGGGHIGPRSSFVLWNGMIDVLLEELPNGEVEACHVLFAGGVHDALSASVVAAMAAPLAERGVRIGVLLGTAYLFTTEAVSSGAMLARFQQEAIQCQRTVVLEGGPGHAIRCAETPFAEAYQQQRRRLLREGGSAEAIRTTLEQMELGRLRMASKGLKRHPQHGQDPQAPRFVALSEEEQHAEGLYMIGQVAALRDRTCSIEELHREIALQGSERLAAVEEPCLIQKPLPRDQQPSDIAIIGMACLMPQAPDLHSYWENILSKVDAITEIPADRWDWRLSFDPDLKARDKVHSKWGGFLDAVPFDPTRYGIPPSAIPSIDPVQLLTLDIVRAALEDAGYDSRPFDRERTSVVFGASGGTGAIGELYAVRAWLPHLLGDVPADVLSRLPEWTEDSFPGLLLSVIAGRVANRFDLHGANFTVDAACASSMAALYVAVRELETGSSDMVIVGGADTVQNPFSYLCFGKVRALSPRGRCWAFDDSADGTVIGEGIGVVVLKRLADAERDGDRIYAVIKAVGRSSDGRARGLTAPAPGGQVRALERAYRKAGFSPATVGLIEAHGTGTVAGDRAEVESLMRVFGAATQERQFCAIGSVKSMVGHLKATAAVAGLIKTALALHHRVLPPTIGVQKPSLAARFPESAFYVNTEPRPWINGRAQPVSEDPTVHSRRAGVSAFGFGGTNFHTVLEEYTGEFLDSDRGASLRHWPTELLLWAGNSREELLAAIQSLEQALAQGARPALSDLAYTLSQPLAGPLRLAIVATSLPDLREKLAGARQALSKGGSVEIQDPAGIYFTEKPLAREERVAFLFPGQGSQYPDMLRDLAILFPEVRQAFERADDVLSPRFPRPLSRYVFPPPAFGEEERRAQEEALTHTQVAQPALGAADMGLFRLLQALGVEPDMVAGHSYGEYVALCAAGVFDEEALFVLSEARGRFIVEAAGEDMGTMAAVRSGPEAIAEIVDSIEGLWMANLNAPDQTVISGLRPAVEEATARLKAQGLIARAIPVACGFHSPLMAPAQKRLAELLSSLREGGTIQFSSPRIEVFSNALAAPYPQDPDGVADLLAEHLLHPVQFVRQIRAMYEAGARIFVEVGPRTVLTGLARRILSEKPCLVVPMDGAGHSRGEDSRIGATSLHHALARLAVHGLGLKLERLYEGRSVRRLNLQALVEDTKEEPLPSTTWLVNGARARPLYAGDAEAPAPVVEAERVRESSPSEVQDSALAEKKAATVMPPPSAIGERTGLEVVTPRFLPAEALSPSAQLRSSEPARVALPPSSGEAEQVMVQYQQLMHRFLDTQKRVMLAYLQGAGLATGGETADSGQVGELSARSAGVGSQRGVASSVFQPTPAERDRWQAEEQLAALAVPEVSTSAPQALAQPEADHAVEARVPSGDLLPPTAMQGSMPGEDWLTQQLRRIVSERTGYPPEMLDLDLDMEADLGIDSIKRVEILGAFQQSCLTADQQLPQEAMEELTGVKTLGGIVQWIARGDARRQPERRTEPEQDQEEGEEVQIPRSVLVPVEMPLRGESVRSVEGSLFLITDDGRGIAEAIAEELGRRGAQVALAQPVSTVGLRGSVQEVEKGRYRADLADPEAVVGLLEKVRQRQGSLAGILHLLPLQEDAGLAEMDLVAWRKRLRLEVKSFFHLMRAARADLIRASAIGGAWLVAATAMGGAFGVGGALPGTFFPGQGGLAGLVKTAAAEWPDVRCQVIDFDPQEPISTLSHHLLREITSGGVQEGGQVEVGYRGARRLVLQPTRAPLDSEGPERLAIDSGWVVLVTGGARGIMAEVARELAERYQPTLILCGRSRLPEQEEPEETAGLTSVQDLKGALIAQMRQAGEKVTPARVEAATSRLLKDRDMRASLAAMRASGARVHYHQVDVRDEAAFRSLIEEIYQVQGRLDGVIHGAGSIEDKLIVDKTPESFDRVFDTKADSVFILSRALRPDSLRFLVLFASAAGRFGNRGQCDYAAGNEVMNKLAEVLNRCWPGRVVSMNWGPWLKRGMVSPELHRQFTERGIQLVPISAGRRILDRELRHGRKEEVEVVVASGGEWEIADSSDAEGIGRPLRSGRFPLLQGATLSTGGKGAIEAICTLDPSHDLCLRDHRLDGHPVLPTAGAIELLAEVVSQGWPDLDIVSLRDIQVLKGIVLRNGAEAVRVVARPVERPRSGQGVLVRAEISGLDQAVQAYYSATVELAEGLPEPPLYTGGLPSNLRAFPASVEEAYRRYLFHGPALQCISEIEGIAEQGIVAQVIPSLPQQCLTGVAAGEWVIDPVVIDSGFQLAIVWARVQYDFTPLPSRFRIYRRFGPLSGPVIRCVLHTRARPDSLTMLTDLFFVSAEGRLLGTFEGAESTCSRALNRLAGREVVRARSTE